MSGFWRGRRVLLTGHTGFKGSWMALWLQRAGAELTGYALPPPTRPSLFEEAAVARGMVAVEGDIRDPGAVAAVFARARPEVVIHMAAQALVRASYADPAGTFDTNVMGTVRVLEAARASAEVRAVVVVTSDKCYENREWIWGYREGEALGGRDPYSASKAGAEIATAAWRRSFFADGPARLATARAGNVIGGGDWAEDRLIPDLVRSFEKGVLAPIRNPLAVRPWQHVLDPLRGYLRLAEALAAGRPGADEAWNFGPGPEANRSVREVADGVCRRWGAGGAWVQDPGAHPREAQLLRLDATRARLLLGWTPALGFEEALDWTVEWHRARARGGDPRALSADQISRYEEKAAWAP